MSELLIISIYVSHFSEKLIKKFGLNHRKELGEESYIVNSTSEAIKAECFDGFKVINVGENVGFSVANNIGIRQGLACAPDFFLIVNPDIKLPENWLISMERIIKQDEFSDVGIFTVPLFDYDFDKDCPSGRLDGVGIYSTWYGRWYDYLAGKSVDMLNKNTEPYEVPAACGALMFIGRDMISALQQQDGYVFNESFFMYKEDIELSLRVKKLGKKIMMIPSSPVYHCRGWSDGRNTAYWKRMLSAKNELNMHSKYCLKYLPYSLLKYVYVRFFEKK